MAEFKISRIRYTWKGSWTTEILYQKDDVVRYGGSTWVCIRKHVASAFASDQVFFLNESDTDPSPAWIKMTDGRSWRDTWQSSRLYNPGDVSLYSGNLYLCVVSHTSGNTFAENSSNWEIYLESIKWNNEWSTSTRYGVGDLVRYNSIVYKCITEHTSNASSSFGLEADQNSWEIYYEAEEYIGNWTTGVRYRVNDLVTYNGTLWVCVEGHTAGSDSDINFDTRYWDIKLPGFEYNLEWDSETAYTVGDVVKYGGYLYYSLTNNYNRSPGSNIYQIEDYEGPLDWQILSKGVNFRGEWSALSSYKTGDVVRRGGNLYVAIIDSTSDGSTIDYADESNWELLNVGSNWRGYWEENSTYSINDTVVYFGSTYKCILAHTSTNIIIPEIDGIGSDYWQLMLLVGSPTGLNNPGDLLTFDFEDDLSETLVPLNVPIGDSGQLVTIDNVNSVFYKNYAQVNRVFYVSTDGVDDTTDLQRGISPFKPWKTVRFAAEQADDDFAGTTTINVDTGIYEEILPIIIPARTVILGSELRSTTIKPNLPITNLALDSTYTLAVLNKFRLIIETLLLGLPLSPAKTASNPLDPSVLALDVTPETAADVQSLIDNISSYINFYVNGTGAVPTVSGTNTASTDISDLNAVAVLTANTEFLESEAIAFMRENFPEYNFDEELCKRDVRRYIDAWKYDIVYTGNYKSILAARYYRNAVLGSLTEDMFYCRDTTGVRNCTLEGLTGTLNPAGVFDIFQRPTGGAYCSLDPGWGPNDDRCWIINRSPYIQGVTTIGTACVGQKIDGSLHNGGNKSIVSNDFTQVLSDGIGAWVLNDARAELVSVFSYYAQVGYLAENGGIIRSTNGNNSYGRFGAISEGFNASEVLTTATVDNRNQDAIVSQVVAGDFSDEIQIIEWTNAGQNYTTAEATIVGSGVNAEVVFDDFRDNAVFEALLTDTSDDPIIQTIGGGGYSTSQNNAQVSFTPGADNVSIVLATNQDNFEAELLGKRILLTGGAGTGQYGYITSYNNTSKLATVSKESNNEPGWDHVIPGTPNARIDNTTAYRIEPRVVFSEPEYIASEFDAIIRNNWIASIYGETYKVFQEVIASEGGGTTIGVDPAQATFEITKNGRVYEVEIIEVGAGYNVDDIIVIDGSEIGGTSVVHDLTITVTEISDDSTNSIIDFEFEGRAASGNFVVIPSVGTGSIYSQDGETWGSSNLPVGNDWTAIASGDKRFVAVRRDSNIGAYSRDGEIWTSITLPQVAAWKSVIYAQGIFLAVSSDQNLAAFSSDGISWESINLPPAADSSVDEWVDITYGKGKFVILANSNNIVLNGEYNSLTETFTWDSAIMDVIADSSQRDWVSIAYGNNRFVAISTQGDVAYSFDGEVWLPDSMPTQDGSTAHFWRQIRYGQGVFFAIGDTGARDIAAEATTGPSTFAATSPDGVLWTTRVLASEFSWRTLAFGNPYTFEEDSSIGVNTPMWILSADNQRLINKVRTGARAQGRATVINGVINEVKLWNPGSGYFNNPTVTIIDPTATSSAAVEPRIADGVLSEPSWINRGLGYRTISTNITISGDGFADVFPVGKFITLENLSGLPNPGTQLLFPGRDDFFSVQTITQLPNAGSIKALFRISPDFRIRDRIAHGTSVQLRAQYSSCRITGHDFLDIGTGNFEETNYPLLYSTGFLTGSQENEVEELNGGRVFYTSTDQSGNFRAGELFAVEQATGIVTISSDFFDFSGLSELRLGGIRVGGTGAVVREFSTDPTFTEDSNNVVPTQRAIAAYLESRLSIGGSEISTASFIAGTVRVGPDFIGSTAGLTVRFPVMTRFEGPNVGISGSMLAQTLFYKSFNLG